MPSPFLRVVHQNHVAHSLTHTTTKEKKRKNTRGGSGVRRASVCVIWTASATRIYTFIHLRIRTDAHRKHFGLT